MAEPIRTDMLPIHAKEAEILAALASHQVVIVCGQTGSGKTTQLPQMCLRAGRTGMIGHTQPRRLAARSVATRIADELGVQLGADVGVKVRFHDQTSSRTRIKLMTDGMLLAELSADPTLRAYGTIIIDEAHERSLNIDVLLAILRRLLPSRPELRIIVTSATIDPQKFSTFFGGPAVAPIIEVSGRMFPVEVRYKAPDVEFADLDPWSLQQAIAESVADAVDALPAPRGEATDTLVFLPGEAEIRTALRVLQQRARSDGNGPEIVPLYSRLTSQEQDRVFRPGNQPRIILATNVAETSITVPRIGFVIDSGLARVKRYDPARKVSRLPVEAIARASAEQRAGRCGRLGPGVCIRLTSESAFQKRPMFTTPEVLRTDLASVLLIVKSLGVRDLGLMEFPDAPDAVQTKDAAETLFELGATPTTAPDAVLTPLGMQLARIPVEPRIARMLLAADGEGSLAEVQVLAAALSVQDPRERPMGRQQEADESHAIFRHETSDFLTLLKLWDQYRHAAETLQHGRVFGWCREMFLSPTRLREWDDMVAQLSQVCDDLDLTLNHVPAAEDSVHRALLTGLISHVACREGEAGSFDYRSVRSREVQIFPGSVLFRKGPKWIMAAELVQTTRLFARTIARIDPAWIEDLAAHMFRIQRTDPHLDAATGEPSAWERVTMGSIVVVPRRRAPIADSDPALARSVFLRDGLAGGRWTGTLRVLEENAKRRTRATAAEAKLRTKGLAASEDSLVSWFEERVPASVCDPASIATWIAEDPSRESLLLLDESALLKDGIAEKTGPDKFPDQVTILPGVRCELSYAWAPGKETDGVSIHVPVAALSDLTQNHLDWLVPGALPELIEALVRTLPKGTRASLENHKPVAEIASECAAILLIGHGSLGDALTEAVGALYNVQVDPAAWNVRAVPDYRRPRIVVVDHDGESIAANRDLPELQKRLAARVERARAEQAKTRFLQSGVFSWSFGDLPETIAAEDGATHFPVIVDRGDSVDVTLTDDPREAGAYTRLGIRRLFELAAREELEHHVDSLAQLDEMCRQFKPLGTMPDLRDGLRLLIAERTFMTGQALVASHSDFENRKEKEWGRLASAAREVGDVVSRTLTPRALVAQRLARGTSRAWAASIADLREHAAYLMPGGFLRLVAWDRLRDYPRYAEAMRARLFALREDGTRAEDATLALVGVHWKRLTGWVATAMADERRAAEAAGAKRAEAIARKAPLPATRRVGNLINLEAGEWTISPGKLPAHIEQFRWLLEDLRVAAFGGSGDVGAIVARLEELWKKSIAADASVNQQPGRAGRR